MKRFKLLLSICCAMLIVSHVSAQNYQILATDVGDNLNLSPESSADYILNSSGVVAIQTSDAQFLTGRSIYTVDSIGVNIIVPSALLGNNANPEGNGFSFNDTGAVLFSVQTGDPCCGDSSIAFVKTTNGQSFETFAVLPMTPDSGFSNTFYHGNNGKLLYSILGNANTSPEAIKQFTSFDQQGPIVVESGTLAEVVQQGIVETLVNDSSFPLRMNRSFSSVNVNHDLVVSYSDSTFTSNGLAKINVDTGLFTIIEASGVVSNDINPGSTTKIPFNNAGQVLYERNDPSLTQRDIVVTDGVTEVVVPTVLGANVTINMVSGLNLNDNGNIAFVADVEDNGNFYRALFYGSPENPQIILRTQQDILNNFLRVDNISLRGTTAMNAVGEIAVLVQGENVFTNSFMNTLVLLDADQIVSDGILIGQGPVPEPSTLALLGLVGMACVRRRSRA